jgi:tetratricopeptide (TPR) repeat protein
VMKRTRNRGVVSRECASVASALTSTPKTTNAAPSPSRCSRAIFQPRALSTSKHWRLPAGPTATATHRRDSQHRLAGLLCQFGDPAAARALYEHALAITCLSFGDDHPTATTIRTKLAELLKQLGDLPAALALYEQALTSARKIHGDDHPTVTTARARLDAVLQQLDTPTP